MKSKIKIGTRRSKLALWQANWVAGQLEAAGEICELVPMDTIGDRMLQANIPEIGSKGVFTEELELELANGTIDLAVHSAKDMPSKLPGGFEIIAFTKREKPHDVLVTEKETPGLDQPITIGTSSTRRVALLKYFYPQVKCVPVRGNLQTRIKKLQSGQMDALMLAFAGIQRLGLSQKIRYHFPTDTFIPAVGQGSMAIEASGDLNPELKMRIRDAVNHGVTEKCLLAERSYLFTIQGGCSIPAFAHAHLSDNQLYMRAGIISLDGQRLVQFERHGTPDKASELGATLADQVLKEGGAEILADIKLQLNRNEDKV